MSRRRTNANQSHQRPRLFGVPPPDEPSPSRSALAAAMATDTWASEELGRLALEVGGVEVLEQLDDRPVPDEPFDWSLVADGDREVVGAVLEALDVGLSDVAHQDFAGRFGLPRPVVPRIDGQYRTIARRLLTLIAVADPGALRRSSAPRSAAAIVWMVLRGNDAFGRPFRANDLWGMFGVSSCVKRGWDLHRAAGFVDDAGWAMCRTGRTRIPLLPDVALLHPSARGRYVEARDRLIGYAQAAAATRDQARPIRDVGHGQFHVRARPVTPRWACTAIAETGRAVVSVTVGETEDDVEVLALSFPDARRLVSMLTAALDAPFPRPVQRRG